MQCELWWASDECKRALANRVERSGELDFSPNAAEGERRPTRLVLPRRLILLDFFFFFDLILPFPMTKRSELTLKNSRMAFSYLRNRVKDGGEDLM